MNIVIKWLKNGISRKKKYESKLRNEGKKSVKTEINVIGKPNSRIFKVHLFLFIAEVIVCSILSVLFGTFYQF